MMLGEGTRAPEECHVFDRGARLKKDYTVHCLIGKPKRMKVIKTSENGKHAQAYIHVVDRRP